MGLVIDGTLGVWHQQHGDFFFFFSFFVLGLEFQGWETEPRGFSKKVMHSITGVYHLHRCARKTENRYELYDRDQVD